MGDKPSTILIVDDDKIVIEQLVTHFRRRNYEPIATADAATVERTLKAFEVHLILLDLRMEKVDGYGVLKGLRERHISTPVLIITAYYDDEKERLKEMGVTEADIIEKPFRDFSRIEEAINRKLEKVAAPGEAGSDYEDEIYFDNRTKVVIVDDEAEVTEMLKEVLEARNYQTAVFTKGDLARNYLLKNECHILIVDMKIPRVSGDRLIREVLAEKPALKIVPISASYAKEMRELLFQAGFDPDKLVTKPFHLPMLLEQIKALAIEAGTLGGSA